MRLLAMRAEREGTETICRPSGKASLGNMHLLPGSMEKDSVEEAPPGLS